MARFYDIFTDVETVEKEFEAPQALDGAIVFFAGYTYEDYSGDAFVLFGRDGVVYEVQASHCS